jgi:16S rRNA pseudouridine516 synthase
MKAMRLDKYLGHIGYGTRSEVQKLIKQKKVSVNGKITNKVDTSCIPYQTQVVVNGEPVQYQEHYHYILHKPAGVITATKDEIAETVLDLLKPIDKNKGLVPVGRLDKDTEGLLILTTDGKFSHQLLSPKKHVEKVYYAEVEGEVTEADCNAFEKGIVLGDGLVCQPGKLEILEAGPISKVHVTICEGKFHQVKRMMASCGKPVLYLKRVKMGGLNLPQDLEKGAYRPLTSEEILALKGEEK